MPISNDSLNKKLYKLLKTQGYDPVPKNSKGDTTPVPDDADVFRFTFKVDGKPVGPAWVTVDSNQELKVYYDDEVMGGLNEDGGEGHIDDFTEFLKQLKQWAQRRQLGFSLENQDHLESDMAQREHVKKQEQINEGYYPMGKTSSYNDSVPSVKIVLQHTRAIQEGEQRFRNIAKIFLENTEGERILAPTTRPGIAKVYARHLAEGGLPHDDRWNHIGGLVEEYTKMAGFVRATRGNQFNESAQQLVNEGIEHYQSLRESLSRMIGHRGYHAYFESWTPALMEDDTDASALNELFVQETMDPRIESVMPILSRIHKKVNEMSEISELAEWAESIVSEKMVMGASTDASASGTVSEDESLTSDNPVGIPEGRLDAGAEIDSPVANAITHRILLQRTDLLAKYGPEKVADAITTIADDMGDWIGPDDEIGSSDVSNWVKRVEQELSGSQLEESHMSEVDMIIQDVINGELDAYDILNHPKTPEEEYVSNILQQQYEEVARDHRLHPDDDFEQILDIVVDNLAKDYGHPEDPNQIEEALDSEKRARLDDLIDQYRTATEPDDYYDRGDYEPEEVIDMIRQEFGDKIAGEVEAGADKMHFSRHGIQRDDPLGWKKHKTQNRITKGGKLFKQDSDYMKNTIKSRYKLSGKSATEGVEEGIGDVAKKVGGAIKTGAKAVGKAIVGKDDDELLKDLKKRAGVRNPQTGKPSMAHSDVEKVDEVDLGQYDAVKAPLKGKDTSDWDKNFREKLALYTKELDQRQKEKKEKSEKVDEDGQFAGDFKTGPEGQWRNKGPKANKPAKVGDLVGANESFINTDAQAVVTEMDKSEDGKGPEGKAKPVKAKDFAKDAEKKLNKEMDKAHKKDVKEGQEDLDAILRIIRK